VNAWFIVTGVFGTLIILNGELAAAATMIREKERGTVEQLLMTPASTLEVVTAEIVPLFVLLMTMVAFVLMVARLVFHVPFASRRRNVIGHRTLRMPCATRMEHRAKASH